MKRFKLKGFLILIIIAIVGYFVLLQLSTKMSDFEKQLVLIANPSTEMEEYELMEYMCNNQVANTDIYNIPFSYTIPDKKSSMIKAVFYYIEYKKADSVEHLIKKTSKYKYNPSNHNPFYLASKGGSCQALSIFFINSLPYEINEKYIIFEPNHVYVMYRDTDNKVYIADPAYKIYKVAEPIDYNKFYEAQEKQEKI